MKESHLRWFGHVQRRVIIALVKKSELIQVEVMKKGRGRPKIILVQVIKKDMTIKEVTKSMTIDRVEWRNRIHMADPK